MSKSSVIQIPINGMHCRSCELLVQDELSKLAGVRSVTANSKSATATLVIHDRTQPPNRAALSQALKRAGYEWGAVDYKLPWFTSDRQIWQQVAILSFFIWLASVLLNKFGFFSVQSMAVTEPSSLATIALLGLTAGFSTCMALVGGLLLAMTSSFTKLHTNATSVLSKLEPTIFFQVGRVSGFMFFGLLLGLLGSAIQPTPFLTAILSSLVAIVMSLMGLQLTGLLPRLAAYQISLPSWLAGKLNLMPSKQNSYSITQVITLGALTFFVPCGFTQVVQLYAVSTASAIEASVVMGVFALATVPGLSLIGSLGSFVNGQKTAAFTRFVGVLVIFMAISSLISAKNLVMASMPSLSGQTARIGESETADIQVIEMTQKSFGYSPKTFTVKKGKPVRWVIDSQDQNSCASSIVLAKYGINEVLKPGKNVFEFTPDQVGTLRFSCSMGMYTGTIQVVE